MKQKTGIVLKQIVCVLLILSLSGCWNSRELDTLGIVMGVGIDVPPTAPDKVHLVAQLVIPGAISTSKNGGKGDGEKAFWNVGVTEDTVFSAIRKLTGQSSRKLFFPHNEVIVIGRGAAEAGIRRDLDLFVRDHESRSNLLLAVSDTSAEEVLSVRPKLEKIPAANIANLIDQYAAATSQTISIKLSDFSDNLMSDTKSAVIPILRIVRDGDEETVEVSGTAVFKSDKMVGELDETESRGLAWVLGKVKSGIIVVKDSGNAPVSIEIIRARAKVKPVLKDGKLTIRIDIFEEGNIGEDTGTKNLTMLPEVSFIEDRITEAIEREIMSAVTEARKLDCDIFGFGEAIHGKYPKQWKEMENNWDELFKTVEIDLSIDANVRLAGKIAGPLVPKKG